MPQNTLSQCLHCGGTLEIIHSCKNDWTYSSQYISPTTLKKIHRTMLASEDNALLHW